MNNTEKAQNMKRSRKTNRALLVIGLILIISLLFANKIITNPNLQPAGGDTVNPVISPSPDVGITATYIASLPRFPTPIQSPATPIIPTATSTLQPPQCTFPLAQITESESTPEEYTFSEPRVVLTAAQGNSYNIAQWLPDNQQVLMTEELRNNPDGLESIELYNLEADESKVYAIRPITHEPPLWQAELNAVVYPIMNYFDIDSQAGTYKFTRQVWVSYSNPDTAQILADNLPQLPFAIKPGGGEMVYLSDKQLSKLDKSLKEMPSIPVDSARWDYAKARRTDVPVSYEMVWQPGTSLIFLYSEGAMGGGGYTFILDADSGQICELGFGGWALGARWSSDGRYLAFIKSTRYGFPTYSADLTLLDTLTGKLITLVVTPQEIEQHYVYDFVWAPDSRHLLAVGSTSPSQNGQSEGNLQGLYLVDFVSGESISILPAHKFYTNSLQSMAWSPDGSKLMMRCPTNMVDQICIISVQKTKS